MECAPVPHCTTHQMLLLPCQKVVNKSNRAHTAFDCGLQKSSNFDYMVCNVTSVVGRTHKIYI